MSRWVLIVLLASVPCFAEPTTKESKVVMELRAEIERLRKEVATLRAELATLRPKPAEKEVRQGMTSGEAYRVLMAGKWKMDFSELNHQIWTRSDDEHTATLEIWYAAGKVENLKESHRRR